MANEGKWGAAELTGVIIILLILLYLPYKMISEHHEDAIANSYYHNVK